MEITRIDPPRVFDVGSRGATRLRDCARIALEADEQVTFVTGSGAEYDVARKSWGFYATPSLNGRLPRLGLRAVLAKSAAGGKYYVLLVERGREEEFHRYLDAEEMTTVCWLDDDRTLETLERQLGG